MATGTYGVIRPADVSIDDIEMYFDYVPNRQSVSDGLKPLAPVTDILSYNYLPIDDERRQSSSDQNANILEGLYNLKLPASIFNKLGIYTIYIKPKTIMAQIVDCSVLSSLPSVRGIVIDSAAVELTSAQKANNGLQGYRIEYLNSDGTKLRNVVRYVVTSNKAVAVSENIGNTTQTAKRYRFDDSGTLIFLQLTPSSSSDVKPNATPFIGNPSGIIMMSNTYFNPVTLEVSLVANDIDTLTDLVAGEQIKDVQKGILTYYDSSRVITKQFDLYELKDDVTNVPLYEVKEKRTTIDETQNFNDITEAAQ